ncbi:response regulator transcription factor [Pseudoflavitalea sp. G-6-1-2]|uniref:response regulator transcription factor n=1 Tax=Pseudoflavitalea sp. G-6-1-2 TaxID=2728841 RepID=UPI00146E0CE5|nr:response regulator transcription factor [Pseudoflavitalea sp. G-6-1-2]NML22672.1 response regulator transcription factor [Pseudoflavitalea sp. G-6-1-2]
MNEATILKVGLAEDHTLVRQAFRSLLEKSVEFQVILEAGNGKEVIDQLQKGFIPDLLILDINMPEMDGCETAKFIQVKYPGIRMLVISMHDTETFLIRMLHAGARGFIKKDASETELRTAIKTIMEEGYYYANNPAGRIIATWCSSLRDDLLGKRGLTEQETRFLKLTTSEDTYKSIAAIMNIPMRSLDTIRDNLFLRLGVQNRVGLAMYAIKSGLVYI